MAWLLPVLCAATGTAGPVLEPEPDRYVVEVLAADKSDARRFRRLARRLHPDTELVRVRQLDGSESFVVRLQSLAGSEAAADVAEGLRGAAEGTGRLSMINASVEVYCDDCVDFASLRAQLDGVVDTFAAMPDLVGDASTVAFRFTVDDAARSASHVYARRGEDRYLAVDVVSGEGVSSKTWIHGGQASMLVGGSIEPVEAEAARAMVDAFGPEAILAFPLGIGDALEEPAVLRAEQIEGCQWVTLDDPVLTALALRRDGAPCGATLADGDGGVLGLEFGAWTGSGGVIVPSWIRRYRGDDRVEVGGLTLDLQPDWDPAWSEVPSPP